MVRPTAFLEAGHSLKGTEFAWLQSGTIESRADVTIRPTRSDIEQLTEPTRSIAVDALHRLRQDG
jgi:hypothetical protein